MSLVVIDCPTGLAGNMLLAALLDLGVPETVIHRPLAALGLEGLYRLEIHEQRSAGLRGLHLGVTALEAQPHHRPWGPLRQQILQAPWPEALRQRVLGVFQRLAEAEAAVHGHAPEAVHFHEVGAIDALVDVVGVCAGLLHLEAETVICAIPPAGHGTVSTAHGQLPVPAPAVLEMARQLKLPLASSASFPPAELTTPTGLALMACWATCFGPPPSLVPQALGVGLGSRTLDRPNLLRLLVAEALTRPDGEPASDADGTAGGAICEPLLAQQAQIDDATAEDLAFLAEALRQAGAVEVFSQPVLMKKGRAGTLITALAPPDRAENLRAIWWRHSTTLGVREELQRRWRLPRAQEELHTRWGTVRLKRAALPDGRRRFKLEHEDLAALARQHNLSLDDMRQLLHQTLEQPADPPAASPEDGPQTTSHA
ncbi:MAG: nickel pincer cofactor biosynthesis protein LarC [Cyanobacteriota bacterium]|nr:nickel pincer cofactor biosynthesis protein LarC [Cyanobacteriota bacterium]